MAERLQSPASGSCLAVTAAQVLSAPYGARERATLSVRAQGLDGDGGQAIKLRLRHAGDRSSHTSSQSALPRLLPSLRVCQSKASTKLIRLQFDLEEPMHVMRALLMSPTPGSACQGAWLKHMFQTALPACMSVLSHPLQASSTSAWHSHRSCAAWSPGAMRGRPPRAEQHSALDTHRRQGCIRCWLAFMALIKGGKARPCMHRTVCRGT